MKSYNLQALRGEDYCDKEWQKDFHEATGVLIPEELLYTPAGPVFAMKELMKQTVKEYMTRYKEPESTAKEKAQYHHDAALKNYLFLLGIEDPREEGERFLGLFEEAGEVRDAGFSKERVQGVLTEHKVKPWAIKSVLELAFESDPELTPLELGFEGKKILDAFESQLESAGGDLERAIVQNYGPEWKLRTNSL